MSAALTLEWINIEFASACNLRCTWCSLDHTKPQKFMSVELLEQILKEVCDDSAFQLKRIELHNGGETLLHPQLEPLLAVIREYKPGLPEINLLTNAVALSRARTGILLDSLAIDTIRFSLDGGTKESFERLRPPARWEKVRDNIARFLETNAQHSRPIQTGAICVLPPEQALETDWMEVDFKQLLESIDDVSLRYPHNWDGSVDLALDDRDYKFHANVNRGKTCYFLKKDMVILPDGNVTVCCADLNGRGILGNLEGSSLRELYNSQTRQMMLQHFANGRKDKISLCRECTGYYD